MGRRVDKIIIQMDVYVDFEGCHSITMSYVPDDDDQIVKLALAKNDAILLAAAKKDLNPELI